MRQKPKFIDPVQRVHAGAVRFGALSAGDDGDDGLYPVDSFHIGFAEMAEDDWRQFELTPENAVAMVKQANEDIAAGKRLHMNYGHDRSGPRAGEIVRVELTPEGGVRKMVRWTDRAREAIRAGEWDGTSPEFFASVVRDEKDNPKEIEGRVLMRPFALSGGALDNDPAMPDLAIAANSQPVQPDTGKEAPMSDTKKLALKLGLPETATPDEIEKAYDEKVKTQPVAAPDPAANAAKEQATLEAVAALVLARIDPAKLAAEVHESAKKAAVEAFRAEEREKECIVAVDGAIRAGRVKKSERDQALKLAKADLESFKTMTASMKVVAPVSGVYVPGAETQETAGAFSDVDLSEPGNRDSLHQAAKNLVEAKKFTSFTDATIFLTSASSKTSNA